jgi:ubiquinone/menaquinone biosynthesis C-methylase UbiE
VNEVTAFNDATAYERFMGRWSRAVGVEFLSWLAPAKNARWLDIGCGTGAFTELIFNTCSPAAISAVDPSAEQVDYAKRQPIGQRADFRVADAQSLPFPDGNFDVVASALVINFVPDRPRAFVEMRRVVRSGGTVAGYVWDFAGRRATGWPFARGMAQIGVQLPRTPGIEDTGAEALHSLLAHAGLRDIAVRPIEIKVTSDNFDNYWSAQTPAFSPTGKAIAALSDADRARLRDAVRAIVLPEGASRIDYPATAHAWKARVA